MRILIVEDDPFIADLLRDGLADDGHECDLGGSAAEGEELARLFPYCVLILDVMLPEGIDAGFRLGERLRAGGVNTPILYLTARGAVEDRIQGLDSGGDDYLGKPFDFGELRARIRALLRRASGHAQHTVTLPQGFVMDLSSRELYQGGVRSGLDVLRYMSLGAAAVMIGRPWVWALGAGGQTGVAHVLQLIRAELATAMALTGRTRLA